MPAFDAIFPADSLEFCPQSGLQDIFVCGTYSLDRTDEQSTDTAAEDRQHEQTRTRSQRRRGTCLVFQAGPNDEIRLLQEIHLPAVPDMKWCHMAQDSPPILGVADSEGHITLFEWSSEERCVQERQKLACAPSETLCLSLDWSNRRNPSHGLGSLIVSLSDGSLCLMRPDDSTGLRIADTWHAHDFEPWIAAWNYWDTNVLYSGGDDLKMKGWDTRQGFNRPIFVNKRFNAGVTTIQSHPHVEHLLAVGSYDNAVYIFDARKPLTPLAQTAVGGGAWRVKWHPSARRRDDLLVACMHDGFKVVRFNSERLAAGGTSGAGEAVRRFDEHDSLAYGVDWCYASTPGEEGTLIGSCSFYDHTMHLWRG